MAPRFELAAVARRVYDLILRAKSDGKLIATDDAYAASDTAGTLAGSRFRFVSA